MYDIFLRSFSTAALGRKLRAEREKEEFTILQALHSNNPPECCPRLCQCSHSMWTSVRGTDMCIGEKHVDPGKHQQPNPPPRIGTVVARDLIHMCRIGNKRLVVRYLVFSGHILSVKVSTELALTHICSISQPGIKRLQALT